MPELKRIRYSKMMPDEMMPDDNSSFKPSIVGELDPNRLEDDISGTPSSEESVKDGNNGANNSDTEMIDYKSELAELCAKLASMKANLLEKDEVIKEIRAEVERTSLRFVAERAEIRAEIRAEVDRAQQNRAAERAEARAEVKYN